MNSRGYPSADIHDRNIYLISRCCWRIKWFYFYDRNFFYRRSNTVQLPSTRIHTRKRIFSKKSVSFQWGREYLQFYCSSHFNAVLSSICGRSYTHWYHASRLHYLPWHLNKINQSIFSAHRKISVEFENRPNMEFIYGLIWCATKCVTPAVNAKHEPVKMNLTKTTAIYNNNNNDNIKKSKTRMGKIDCVVVFGWKVLTENLPNTKDRLCAPTDSMLF